MLYDTYSSCYDKTTCNRPLIRATLKRLPGRKRTSAGGTIQQDIDTRFERHEADKLTAPWLRAEGKTISDRRSVAQTDRWAGERTRVETPRDVRRVAVVPAS